MNNKELTSSVEKIIESIIKGESLKMSIPPQPDDADMLLRELIERVGQDDPFVGYPLRATFSTSDPMEIKRLAKASDMAMFIWELVHNGWRKFKETPYEYEPAWERIHELLEEHNINIDELTE